MEKENDSVLTSVLNDGSFCFELTRAEVEGHHDLATLATQKGYPSLSSFLDNGNLWGERVSGVGKILEGEYFN